MELKFDAGLDYQREAIRAVTDLFEGQSEGYVSSQEIKGMEYNWICLSNNLTLGPEDLEKNLRLVQKRHGLEESAPLKSGAYDFDIEMETGTGKTYVYLRSILELKARYGFSKFIIVVPSIAIKEGVMKSLDITKNHFQSLYNNLPYDYFTYDSKNIEQVRSFAISDTLQIMVINIDAFRKDIAEEKGSSKSNVIHRQQEKLNGERPIDYIARTRPIVIIDEPQSVDSTAKAKEAVSKLNPLCVFRYSATHREKHHPIYKLDAVDAFERGLVKEIQVKSITAENDFNAPYLRLVSVTAKKGQLPRAKVELDILGARGEARRTERTVAAGTSLYEESGGREVYKNGFVIEEISAARGDKKICLSSGETLREGEAVGLNPGQSDELKRVQIRETIRSHFEAMLRYRDKGIKVLSLFFIDRVENYRRYLPGGGSEKGKYAVWFEEEFDKLRKRSEYKGLFPEETAPATLHNGYFSKDNHGAAKDTTGKSSADESAFNLIMRDKEKLLSLSEPLAFVFSHSALREGWDNPNVFQICTLNESKSDIKKRQEIGRGLRLCVNQEGERNFNREDNLLTIVANESYEDYAKSLQQDYEEAGLKFEKISSHIRPEKDRQTVTLRENALEDPEFKALWDRIKYKTSYRIALNTEELITNCVKALDDKIIIYEGQISVRKAALTLSNAGVGTLKEGENALAYGHKEIPKLPDIVTFLEKETRLKKETIGKILSRTSSLKYFLRNPQAYMTAAGKVINEEKVKLLQDGIKYFKLGGEEYYAQELFRNEELYGFLHKNLLEVPKGKSPYNYVIYDSEREREFAKSFEENNAVLRYVKLPWWFKIPTPLGTYNPDWALLVKDDDGTQRLYLVLESKGTTEESGRRGSENLKIHCGKKHFRALDNEAFLTDKSETSDITFPKLHEVYLHDREQREG